MMQQVETRKVPAHTFNRAAATTLAHASEVCSGRADEYNDSWSLKSLNTPWLDNLLRSHPRAPSGLDREYKRLIIMASMLDIKLSRLGGPWKEDTAIDSINYTAAYCGLREEFEKEVAVNRNAYPTSPGSMNPQQMVNPLAADRYQGVLTL